MAIVKEAEAKSTGSGLDLVGKVELRIEAKAKVNNIYPMVKSYIR